MSDGPHPTTNPRSPSLLPQPDSLPRLAGRTLRAALLFSLILQGCGDDTRRWYRGNTHAHTVICEHADSTPETVANWYLEHGYNFLILSEHNHFIDPETVKLPGNRRDDFILIPGEEVTALDDVHSTGMNTRNLTPQSIDLATKTEVIQDHVDSVRGVGGEPILNHPNYLYAITAADILPVKRLHMFELFNGHPLVNNFGDDAHPATEDLWDELLSKGMVVYGVSSDDAHYFNTIDEAYSNPGRGWVMVRAPKLTPDAITEAMQGGDFYASSGVMLSRYSATANIYLVEVDREQTARALSAPELRGRRVDATEAGFTIEFIGPEGVVLSATRSIMATFAVDDSHAYVRARVTLRRAHQEAGGEEFYAWGQPVFTDGRTKE